MPRSPKKVLSGRGKKLKHIKRKLTEDELRQNLKDAAVRDFRAEQMRKGIRMTYEQAENSKLFKGIVYSLEQVQLHPRSTKWRDAATKSLKLLGRLRKNYSGPYF